MAISKNIRITQTADPATYCRIYDGASFTSKDSVAFLVTNTTAFALWADANDFVYVGKATTFGFVGFRMAVAGVGYGTFTFEYAASGSYTITGGEPFGADFRIDENVPAKFPTGSHFTVTGSTSNDGTYVVVAPGGSWNGSKTVIPVAGPLAAVWDGTISTIWTVLTVYDNNTVSFSASGFMEWAIPGDWTTRTVDSTSAYWVRAVQAAGSPTPAQAYHLLPNMTLNPPLTVKPEPVLSPDQRFHYDISDTIRQTDTDGKQAKKLTVDCTHLAATMMQLNLMRYWYDYKKRLYIEDLSVTSPLSFTTDAMYKTYSGFLVMLPGEIESPGKMIPAEYSLEFLTDTITSLITTLGITS